jgi:S-formylglutathione hydrolase
MELVSQNRSFGGWHKRYKHQSHHLNCTMTFAIYLPPQAETQPVPVLYWLSGLTCTDENFMQKAGAQRVAAELGIAIVCPDTSPRGTSLPNEHDSDDLGSGAGFYINATQAPWDQHYHMYDYVVDELPSLIKANFSVTERCSISGHSMGGHGALIVALKNPRKYCSLSVFAPICHPIESPTGKKVFGHYLGDDIRQWEQYDASLLIATATEKLPILMDQGEADEILSRLNPEALKAACEKANYPLRLRMRKDYDHGYYFVASFIEEHLRYHAEKLFSAE